MPRKRTPKPLAPRHLLEELRDRQQDLIAFHSKQLRANSTPASRISL
jgi:hypothetical protein